MTLTTPPRPLDVEALFPDLAAHRGTATRLHPRAGSPGAGDSHVGGPLLWPADEPWPTCDEPHEHSGPLLAVAQLYSRDVPDLPAGPDGCDLLQVFWCPFDRHGPTGHGMHVRLRWRRSAEVREALAEQPRATVVGFDGYVPNPCVLHPERVTEYPYIELLTGELGERVEEWEDAQEEAAYEEAADEEASDGEDEDSSAWPSYQSDLSIAPGWKAGGHAAWNVTGPGTMDCRGCGHGMELLLTIDTYEWRSDSTSWRPAQQAGAVPGTDSNRPTGVAVGNYGRLNIFACPEDPAHPHGFAMQ
ncbi:hypothetical protein OG429_36140 [Streptomyces sp. NBC_00190]|uniref:hypothetical protein n=1 Tax=unclassified Streptomyces TaxID=2593676 RepID=UPI002E2E6EC6|nr:hypothetical protein [Streptomyces sp. NBC_00190]WSZ44224.1 hypothetical protein OG239_38605 [Streptomyces sp. NBC_00868]